MTCETPTTSSLDSLAPGALVLARDEDWMVTSVGPSEDGRQVVHVRGSLMSLSKGNARTSLAVNTSQQGRHFRT